MRLAKDKEAKKATKGGKEDKIVRRSGLPVHLVFGILALISLKGTQ
jgi:hypothetical protein